MFEAETLPDQWKATGKSSAFCLQSIFHMYAGKFVDLGVLELATGMVMLCVMVVPV